MAFRLRATLASSLSGRALARTSPSLIRSRPFHASAGRYGLADLANDKAALVGYDPSKYAPGPDMDVLYIGGGGAMFGTTEGPWNIASRVEYRLGPRLKVLGVVDPNKTRVGATIQKKAGSLVGSAYKDTPVFGSVEEFITAAHSGSVKVPKAIFIAAPPVFRGSLTKGKDIEIQLMDAFPNAHFFLEKPVATAVPWEKSVADTKVIAKRFAEHKGVVSVGYVLRYIKGTQEMKKILKENNLRVMNTVARYMASYEFAPKGPFWDITKLQGAIVEQGTHLCDLSRHFGGDVLTDSISAHALEAYEEPAQLGPMLFDETEIPLRHRLPRATAACWKYKSGAVGTFMHGLTMRGTDFSIEIEVYADGHQLILQDPFGQPSLSVRRPGSDIPEVTPFMGDDPYQSEIDTFIDAIEGIGEPHILSDFADAAKSYEMTWYIRNSAEASSKKVREANGIELPEAPVAAEGADGWRKADL